MNIEKIAGDTVENLESGTENKHVRRAAHSKKKTFNWASDGDGHRRSCTVRWYTRKLMGIANHWILTFDWGDYEATYEADDDGGYLIPRWKTGGPGRGCWWLAAKFELRCSPREVNQKAENVPINGAKYVLTKVNCHAWVQCMAEALNFDHLLNLPEEESGLAPLKSVLDFINDF